MQRRVVLGAIVSIGALTMTAAAYQAPAAPKAIDIMKLKDNLYVLTSSTPGNAATFSGGNVAVFITDNGRHAGRHEARRLGSGHPRQAQDRHGQAGDDESSTRTRTAITPATTGSSAPRRDRRAGEHEGEHGQDGRLQGRQREVPAVEDLQRQDDAWVGQRPHRPLLLRRGHTNGDTFVVFPALRVLHTGDVFAWKDAPLCDRDNGGSCVSFPQTLAKVMAS